jgi:carotenoid cleavage dioxygenase
VDPRTGELLFFGYDLPNEPRCVVGALDAEGELSHLFPVHFDEARMMHDCAFTENHFILVAPPLVFRPKEMVKDKCQPIAMDPDQPLRMGVLPRSARNSDAIRWFELPAGGVFHVMNAWEEGEKCTIYACRSETINLSDFAPVGDLNVDEDSVFQLYRFELNLATGDASQTPITPRKMSVDFPASNPRLHGQPSRYGYLTRLTEDVRIESLIKVDLTQEGDDSIAAEYRFGEDCYGGECAFVPRHNPETEDDGYLLVHVRDEKRGRSYVDVIDARTMDAQPVARVRIPARVPYGFHCTWIPAS